MTRWTDITVLCMLAGAACTAHEKRAPKQDPEAGKPDAAVALKEMLAAFEKAGIELDVEGKKVTIPAEVGYPDQPLEFLLCNPRGKAHEALLLTKVKASLLNAALIALGLEQGKNARIVDKDPLPTPEEVKDGAPFFDVFSPEGMKVWFTVSFEPPDGKGGRREVAIEDLILDMSTGKPVAEASWIYLGGNLAPIYRDEPPVFVADFEGNLVSIVYKMPPNHLVTMRHERSVDDQVWWVHDSCPPSETPIRLTIHVGEPELVKQRDQKAGEGEGGEKRKGG